LKIPHQGTGTILSVGTLKLIFKNGKITLADPSQAIDVSADVPQNTGFEWNVIELSWSKGTAKLLWNQKALLETPLPQGMPIPAMGRGLDIADNRRRIMPTPIAFGPFKDAALDDLKMSK
jgi:hypothetical protein